MIFNPASPTVLHLDLNSCFASVEQQANPLLRDKPVAVAASARDFGCILAPSVEAKLYGVKTGMSVADGRKLCPYLIVREADPPKYREIHQKIGQLLEQYSPSVTSKSIDEYALDLSYLPAGSGLVKVAQEIKTRIKTEIGEYLRTSVGLSTNWILAKLASGLHKPDGLDLIDHTNYLAIYQSINLQEFCGINLRNEARLNKQGIYTPLDFYRASRTTLRAAFGGVVGADWHTRLRGYELDNVEFARRSFGQSYVLPHPMEMGQWRPILAKLVSKAARRMRCAGYLARGVHLSLRFASHSGWHTSATSPAPVSDDPTLLSRLLSLYEPIDNHLKVKKLAISFFDLVRDPGQLSLLADLPRQQNLVAALDSLNSRYGEYSVTYASMLGSTGHVRDAIAFGR